MYSRHWPWF